MRKWLKTDGSVRLLRGVMLIALIAVVLSWSKMSRYETLLMERGSGIITFQLAFTLEQAAAILAGWGADGIAAARQSIGADFAFIPAYVLFFSAFTLMLARPLKGWLFHLGLIVGLLSFIAGLLDLTENFLHLNMLAEPALITSQQVMTVGIVAVVKFTLLMLASLYWPVAAIGLMRRHVFMVDGVVDMPVDGDPPLW